MTCRWDVSRGTNPSNTCAEWPIPARRMSVGPSPPQSTTSSCTLSATPMKVERADGGIPWASTDPPVAIAAARVRTAAVVRRDTVLVVRGNGRMRGMSAPPGSLFVSDRPWASVCGLTDGAYAAARCRVIHSLIYACAASFKRLLGRCLSPRGCRAPGLSARPVPNHFQRLTECRLHLEERALDGVSTH